MKKIATILLTVALVFVLLSGCGDSSSSPSAGDSSLSSSGGEGDVTWTWGNFRGLYGDAEVAFNEDGGRDTVLLK